MKLVTALATAGIATLAAACVTVNIYFPAAAAEKAADRIIEDVWGPGEPAPEAEPTGHLDAPPAWRSWALAGLDLLVPAAHAQQADFDIETPAIRAIEASMRSRHERLKPYYDAGAVGLTRDGLIEIRDLGAVSLAERNTLRKLVADDNADRRNLYREIALANGRPEWEDEIRETFARRWIERAAAGWYYRGPDGDWRQKG